MTSLRYGAAAAVALGLLASSVPLAAKVTLTFGGYYSKSGLSAPWAIMQKAIKDYEKTHPGVKIDYIDDTGVYWQTKMLTLIAAGKTPDIISLYQPWLMDYAERRLVEAFPENFTSRVKPKFNQAALSSLSYSKRLYALPTEYQVTALLSNNKILREAGVGSVPQSWSDLDALMTKLTVKNAAGQIQRWGLAADLAGWATPALFRILLSANGGVFSTKDGIAIDSSAGIKALEDLRRWFYQTKVATGNVGLIAQHKCAFTIGYPWHLYFIEEAFKDQVAANIGVNDMPAGPARRAAYDYSWGMAVAKGSKNKAEAYRFVEWLTTHVAPDEGMTYIGSAMASLGSLSAARADEGKGKFGKLSAWFNGFARNTDYSIPAYGLGNHQKIDEILYSEVQPVIDGKPSTNPPSALASAKKRLQALLKAK